jgi:hypothetical protein
MSAGIRLASFINLIHELGAAGVKRRIAVVAYLMATTVLAVALATELHPPLLATVAILCISTIAFSLLAVWTYDANLWWRYVDYPWILATVATLTLSITNIDNSLATAERTQISLISGSLATSTVFEDLREWDGVCRVMRDNAPQKMSEPFINEFGKMRERDINFRPCSMGTMQGFLGSIAADTSPEALSNDGIISQIYTMENWDYFCRTQKDNVEGALYKAIGNGIDVGDTVEYNLKGFYAICKSLSGLRLQQPLATLLELRSIGNSSMLRWTLEEPWRLRWWYLTYAFFVGLRLAKVTAEITQARTANRNRRSLRTQ